MEKNDKKQALGRGLNALFGDYEAEAIKEGTSQKVDIHLLDNNPDQPRKDFDDEKLAELAASISQHGIVQPIVVVKNKNRYTIVAGERRFRAAKLAGLKEVPIIVSDLTNEEVFEIALIENIQRENLNPIDEAAAMRYLMQQNNLTQDELAARLGKSRSSVANSVRLLNLSTEIQKLLREGKLSSGHAKLLLGEKNEDLRKELAFKAAEISMSVKELEKELSKNDQQKTPKKEKKLPPEIDKDMLPFFRELTNDLRSALDTKVSISGNTDSGKITIEYFDRSQLEFIIEKICHK